MRFVYMDRKCEVVLSEYFQGTMILSRKRYKFNKLFLKFPQNYKKQLCRRKKLRYFDSNGCGKNQVVED